MENDNTSGIRLKYSDPGFPVSVVYTDLSSGNISDLRWQWHEDIKIIIINSGTAQVSTDEQRIRLLPGQAMLLSKNLMHSVSQYGQEPCSYYSIAFHSEFVLGPDTSTLGRYYSDILETRKIRFMILEENISWQGELLDHLNSAIAASLIKAPGYELAIKGYLCLFYSTLLRHIDDSGKNDSDEARFSPDEQRVKAAVNFIRAHFAEKISLEDIAADIHLSKSECCRCFKRSIGLTPFEYLMKYRIFEAANMLRDPLYASYSIADIALSVGFNNLSYFSKLFGKYMNCTPRQYRKAKNATHQVQI